MDITLRQIRYFVAVAEAGKVSLAGAMLGVSQSAITESLQALESQAGVRLMKRHNRGINLTDEGHQFLTHARRIISAVSGAAQMLANSRRDVRGRIRLGVTATVAGYYLAQPLLRFQQIWPNVEVNVTELDRADIEYGLIGRELDLGILLASTIREARRLETQILFTSPRRLWIAPSHRLAALAQIRLREVADEPYLLLAIDDNEQTTSRYWRRHRLQPNIAFRSVSIEAVRNLVATGAGVTILSDMVYRPFSLEGDRIEAREIADEIPKLGVALCWKRGVELDESCAAFRDFNLGASSEQRGR